MSLLVAFSRRSAAAWGLAQTSSRCGGALLGGSARAQRHLSSAAGAGRDQEEGEAEPAPQGDSLGSLYRNQDGSFTHVFGGEDVLMQTGGGPRLPASILFLGAPGAGKGTYATRLSKKIGIPHISPGEILRKEMENATELGQKVKPIVEAGQLVPDEIVTDIVLNRLSQLDCSTAGYILDGYPRNVRQAEALSEFGDPRAVMNFIIPEDILVQKLSGRRVCGDCKTNFNIAAIDDPLRGTFMPPLLPKSGSSTECDCGGSLEQRADDAEEVQRARLKVYEEETKPLVEFYKDKGLLTNVEIKLGLRDLPGIKFLLYQRLGLELAPRALQNHHRAATGGRPRDSGRDSRSPRRGSFSDRPRFRSNERDDDGQRRRFRPAFDRNENDDQSRGERRPYRRPFDRNESDDGSRGERRPFRRSFERNESDDGSRGERRPFRRSSERNEFDDSSRDRRAGPRGGRFRGRGQEDTEGL